MRLFLFSLPLLALAPAACRTATPHFNHADANGNGHVTLAEWQRHIVTTLHAENDTNRDGRVTFEEWTSHNPGANRARFMKIDTDGDAAISWAEGLKFVQDEKIYDDSFHRMDADGNGTLERKEALHFRDLMATPGF